MMKIMGSTNIEITKEDIELAEKMWTARQKGLYFNSGIVTNLYNKLYDTNLAPTSCGSCIRRRIEGIWNKIQEFKKLTEAQVQEETNEKESGSTSTRKVAKKQKKEVNKVDKDD